MSVIHYNISNPRPPFVLGYALQEYFSAEEGILAAKKANYSHWYIDGSLESDVPNQWNSHRIDALLHQMEQYHITPLFHGNFKAPLASDVQELRQAAIAYTKKEIDLASVLQAPIILHGGAIVEPRLVNKLKREALENYLDTLYILSEYAYKRNVRIYLENLSNYKHYKPFHYIFTHIEEFDYILPRIPELKLFLDIGHANIGEGKPIEIIKKYHQQIIGMSLSNNDGLRDQHLALDQGNIDYQNIITAILQCDWQGIIAFETRGRTPAESIEDLCKLYQQVINNILPKVSGF